MNWILDRIALILAAIACALGAWAFYRYTGQWAGPIIMTVVIVGLFVENHRLRKLLAAHGIESRPRGRQKYLKALRRHDRPSSIRRPSNGVSVPGFIEACPKLLDHHTLASQE